MVSNNLDCDLLHDVCNSVSNRHIPVNSDEQHYIWRAGIAYLCSRFLCFSGNIKMGSLEKCEYRTAEVCERKYRYNHIDTSKASIYSGSLESLYIVACQVFPGDSKVHLTRRADILRYARAAMKTLFLAANADFDLTPLVESNMLTIEEEELLRVALPGTRPHVIMGWIASIFTGSLTEKRCYQYGILKHINVSFACCYLQVTWVILIRVGL